MLFYRTIKCQRNPWACSVGKTRKRKKDVTKIVVHFTGNTNDTPRANAKYFRDHKDRYAGAHIVIGVKGRAYKCANYNHITWSVGGGKLVGTRGGTQNGIVTNSNSVSIELCSMTSANIPDKQMEKLKKAIRNIKKRCPAVNDIVRHYDVTGKDCPHPWVDETVWKKIRKELLNEII